MSDIEKQETITIDVTSTHIEQGIPMSSHYCAFALAVRDEYPEAWDVYVDESGLVVEHPSWDESDEFFFRTEGDAPGYIEHFFKPNEELVNFMHDFDLGQDVAEPTTITLKRGRQVLWMP